MKKVYAILCATVFWLTPASALQSASAKIQAGPASKNSAASAKEIADAKAKGWVWVNLGSGVYHKDGEFYGKTKRGQFMSEPDAQKAGHRAAKSPAASKKAAPKRDAAKK